MIRVRVRVKVIFRARVRVSGMVNVRDNVRVNS